MNNYLAAGVSPSMRIKREPLRTFGEFSEEFGIKRHSLQGMLGMRNGPKPVRKHQTNNYYNVREMRTWWAAQPESKEVKA